LVLLILFFASPARAALKETLFAVYSDKTIQLTDTAEVNKNKRTWPGWTGDSWWGEDKAKHLSVSFAISSAACMGLIAKHNDRNESLAGAIAGTIVIGLGKEIWDTFHPGQPSWKDLAADAVGALAGGFAAWAIN
jgi:uncharacterized protein YfiM (DUF2279 family)